MIRWIVEGEEGLGTEAALISTIGSFSCFYF